jgi:2'-5' RNA ligase
MRMFAAIVPPASALGHLAGALEMVAPQLGGGARGPWTPQQNWHVTLAFYGEVPESRLGELCDLAREAAENVAPFELELAGAGTYHGKVGWVGVSGGEQQIAALRRALARERLGLGRDGESHRSHLTVSYAVREAGLADAMRALTVYRGPAWTAGSVALVRSDLGQGPGGRSRYTKLYEAPFGGEWQLSA